MSEVNIPLVCIWFVFFLLFIMLGRRHLIEAKSSVPQFRLSDRRPVRIQHHDGTPLDQPLIDFVGEFNGYVRDQNDRARKANRLAAIGYFAAALTALVSAAIELDLLG